MLRRIFAIGVVALICGETLNAAADIKPSGIDQLKRDKSIWIRDVAARMTRNLLSRSESRTSGSKPLHRSRECPQQC